jgi:hypothetical protein
MTMVAEAAGPFFLLESEHGQSVIEFALLLPVLVAMLMVLIRVNAVMQISIVDQQYARAQAWFLTYNSPYYPELKFHGSLINRKTNQMVLGVSDTVYDSDSSAEAIPEATTQLVTRSKRVRGSSANKETPASRSIVRVRNTVTLCTQTYWLGTVPLKESAGPPNYRVNRYHLNDSTRFDYLCGSQLAYE